MTSIYKKPVPTLTIEVKENDKRVTDNEKIRSFKDPGRIELTCPSCKQAIGFVNYLIVNHRKDTCSKSNCKERFIFQITINRQTNEN